MSYCVFRVLLILRNRNKFIARIWRISLAFKLYCLQLGMLSSTSRYPVIRAVKGLKGNAAIGRNKNDTFLSDYRSGILLHTGEWENWNPSKPMPNSDGCIHAHPEDLKTIDKILEELGVNVRPNPLGKLPYPYQPQGLLSVEEIGPEFPQSTDEQYYNNNIDKEHVILL